VLVAISLVATLLMQPDLIGNCRAHAWGWLIPWMVVGGLAGMHHARTRQRDRAAFLSFSACLVGMLAGVAFGLYPRVPPSTLDTGFDLTVRNSAAQSYGLRVALIWWSIATALRRLLHLSISVVSRQGHPGRRRMPLEQERRHGLLGPKKGERDFRDVAFLASQACPERSIDHAFDGSGVGEKRHFVVGLVLARQMTVKVARHRRGDRSGGRIGGFCHGGFLILFLRF
jgi:hypothetical protein